VTDPAYMEVVPSNVLGAVVDDLRRSNHVAHHLTFLPGMDHALFETLPPEMRSKLNNPQRYGRSRNKAEESGSGCVSWMGVFHSPCVPGKMRRVDIKFYPHRERVFAALYFTGNGHFNRAMRLWAQQKYSYKLDGNGLFYWGTTTRVMEADTEREVFDKLGIAWKELTERESFAAVQAKDSNECALQLQELSRKALQEETQEYEWIE